MSQSLIAVNFHGIGTPERELEQGEAPYWISEAQYTDILDQIAGSPMRDRIRITFDDSNLSDLSIGLSGLLERGLDARFFVLTGRIGKQGSLGAKDIIALEKAGMVIGSHGIDHLNWTDLSPADLQREVTDSRTVLEQITGHAITEAAIPFGAWNARVLRALKDAGYTRAWSSDAGTLRDGRFLAPRNSVRGDMSDVEFSAALSGQLPVKRQLRRAVGILRKRLIGIVG